MKELLALKERYSSELQSIPAFQNYSAVCKTIELLQPATNHSSAVPSLINKKVVLKTTFEQRELIISAVESCFVDSANKRKSTKALVEALSAKGINIPGKFPGTTLGAILNGQRDKFAHANKLWSLKEFSAKQQALI